MAQTVSVTGQRLTSARTTFTIADSAKAKASGDYGNCLTSQVVFTSGHSDNKKANTVKRVRKSRRTSKPLWENRNRAFAPNIVHTSANRTSPLTAAMWIRNREREHCPLPLQLHVKNHTGSCC